MKRLEGGCLEIPLHRPLILGVGEEDTGVEAIHFGATRRLDAASLPRLAALAVFGTHLKVHIRRDARHVRIRESFPRFGRLYEACRRKGGDLELADGASQKVPKSAWRAGKARQLA